MPTISHAIYTGYAHIHITLQRPICAVVGATGTGKSRLATALAAALGGEIINGDALQVYKGADILTNKPSTAERGGIPHHLLGTIDRSDTYSVQRFERDALEIIARLHSVERLPVLVGGTHYYTQAVLFKNTLLTNQQNIEHSSPSGFSEVPIVDERDPNKDISGLSSLSKLSLLSTSELYARLKALDPVVAQRWHPHDRRRIQRSLEICLSTGQRPSDLYRAQCKATGVTNKDSTSIFALTDQASVDVSTHALGTSKDICLPSKNVSITLDSPFCGDFNDKLSSNGASEKIYTNITNSLNNLPSTSFSKTFSAGFVSSDSYKSIEQTNGKRNRFKACIFWIHREPKMLDQLLDQRVEEMCAAGVLNDIQMLYSEWDVKNKQNKVKKGSNDTKKNSNDTNNKQKESIKDYDTMLDMQDAKNKPQSKIGMLYSTLESYNDFENIQNNIQNSNEDNIHYDISDNLRGIWQAIGFRAFLPYLELPEDTLPETKRTCFMHSVAAMQLATRQYARKQVKWIRNKLYPLCRSSGPDIRFYLLDATDPTHWETEIQNLAITLALDFLHDRQGPDPLSLNAAAMQLLAPKPILK
ncbi:tRNA dimethylallyltransferase [Pneumocystis jirovecii RU7]|uniref:tRNA dimethylallyltransferase n=1 Tax=Pneumocystis jirovecii (strain RU7) TaxID=1408657 RepID=A0A0W4ZJV3_PNEJ7|nr:tRNA dimethylallyltransferase [Pneumocystis jirovecii RU7]KTW28653.1 tRNA dimethylallyltransferase [Pneumocystis jirovecii RU7]